MEDVKVSIICNTYNHGKYIKDALESFVRQKVNFRYEILVHDDASTDETVKIIKEYEKKYPDLFRPIYEEENQYSKKPGILFDIQNVRAKGKYVSICEGDDYWIDEYKLQKQYDALEKYPDADICATAAFKISARDKKKVGTISPKDCFAIINPEEVILGGGGYVATCTLMYRRKLDQEVPLFRKNLILDYTLQIHGALHGGMIYLPDVTGVYRLFSEGSWSSKMSTDTGKCLKWTVTIEKMLRELDSETQGIYTETIHKKILKNNFNNLKMVGNLKEIREKKYAELYREMSASEKIKLYFKYYLPFLISLKKRWK